MGVNTRGIGWAVGVTSHVSRRSTLLPQTLTSLTTNAGFTVDRLFVDGDYDAKSWMDEFHLDVTCRYPTIRTFGNWALSLAELYIRSPWADRYALFQDDCICMKNLRQYLEKTLYPDNGYMNLYCFPENQRHCPKNPDGSLKIGWFPSNQMGRGAVGLVFSRKAVTTLFSSTHFVERPMDAGRGWRAVDGGVVTALKKAGWREFVHYPTLVQHTGDISAMGNKRHAQGVSFLGQSHDAMELVGKDSI